MDKLEQIKETIEGSAELLDKQPEYNFQFDEIIRIIQKNNYDYARTTYLDPRRYNDGWDLDTDVRYHRDRWYSASIRPSWVNSQIYTNIQTTTSGMDTVVATPRLPEEWCDLVTDNTITF